MALDTHDTHSPDHPANRPEFSEKEPVLLPSSLKDALENNDIESALIIRDEIVAELVYLKQVMMATDNVFAINKLRTIIERL